MYDLELFNAIQSEMLATVEVNCIVSYFYGPEKSIKIPFLITDRI